LSAIAVASKARLEKKGLSLAKGLSFEEWVEIGQKLGWRAESTVWALGDWCFFGQFEFGKKYEAALEVTGLGYQTLANYARVAGRFELSRRRDDLSFAHHEVVAALAPAAQDMWLDRAADEGWSREELRDAIRAGARTASNGKTANGGTRPAPRSELTVGPGPSLAHLTLSVEQERAEAWERAAAKKGLSVVDWAVAALDKAAR
jgi:hypothetical protein